MITFGSTHFELQNRAQPCKNLVYDRNRKFVQKSCELAPILDALNTSLRQTNASIDEKKRFVNLRKCNGPNLTRDASAASPHLSVALRVLLSENIS